MMFASVKLGELYKVHNGLSKGRQYFGKGNPFLSFSTVFNNWFLPETLQDFVETTDKEQNSFSIQRGDVFITRTSETMNELGMSSVALKDYPTATYNGFVKRLRPIDNRVLPEYIGYYLRSPSFRSKFLSLTGSMISRASLRNESLLDMEILLPPLDYQKKIASYLMVLDKLIKCNIKQNDNLATQAMLYYKQLISTNALSKCNLGDIASIIMGQSPSGSSYNEEGKGLVFYQGRTDFGFRFPTRRVYTTKPKKIAEKNDVLLSVRAPVGDINVANESCCIGRGLCALRSLYSTPSFLYYTMDSLRPQLNQFNGGGTIFGSINQASLNSLQIHIPAFEQIKSFETKAAPLDAMIMNNNNEILRIASLRDFLLPRLMSGEIPIEN